MNLLSLPTELLADILSGLDVPTLIAVSHASKKLRSVCSDDVLNPWRAAISSYLREGCYEEFATPGFYNTVPRQNWIEILSRAPPAFLLDDVNLLHLLEESVWKEAFKKRFLPSWQERKRAESWRECFMQVLYHVLHLSTPLCTADDAWVQYLILNTDGSVDVLSASSNNFDPPVIFDELKRRSNLTHLPTRIHILVKLANVRILTYGVCTKAAQPSDVNENAHRLLLPPFLEESGDSVSRPLKEGREMNPSPTHPQPSFDFERYPYSTPGSDDFRLLEGKKMRDSGLRWVGGMMLAAQFLQPPMMSIGVGAGANDSRNIRILTGAGRRRYASMAWADLQALAPWMAATITKRIDGPGLGN